MAAGALPNQVLPAEYFNEIVRRNSAWLQYLADSTGVVGYTDDWSYADGVKSRIVNVSPAALIVEPGDAADASLYDGVGAFPFVFSNPGGAIVNALLPLNRYLPAGGILQAVEVALAYDDTGVDACELFLETQEVNWTNVTAGSTPVAAAGSTSLAGGTGSLSNGIQNLSASSIAHTIQTQRQSVLRLRIAGGPQLIYGLRLTYDSRGPRDR